jgi:hypothetical protein
MFNILHLIRTNIEIKDEDVICIICLFCLCINNILYCIGIQHWNYIKLTLYLYSILYSVLYIIVCHFVLFLLAIVLSVYRPFTNSEYPFGTSNSFLGKSLKFAYFYYTVISLSKYIFLFEYIKGLWCLTPLSIIFQLYRG